MKELARAQVLLCILLTIFCAVMMLIALARDRARWVAWRRAVVARSGKWRSLCAALSAEEVRVREEADAKHIAHWRTTFQIGAVVCLVASLPGFHEMVKEGDLVAFLSSDPGPEVAGNILHPGGFGPLLFALGSSMLFTAFPALLTKRSLYAWIVLMSLRLDLPLFAPAPLYHFLSYETVITTIRVLLYSHCTSIPFVVIMNVWSSGMFGYLARQKLVENGLGHCPTNNMNSSLGGFLTVTFVVLMHRHMVLSQIRCTLEAKSSRNVESAVETLLHGMCEAVVQVRQDLTLKQPSPQLGALLLHPRELNMGCSFLELMHEKHDRDKLVHVMSASQEASIPGTVHVSMRDTDNLLVPVQLFHTPCMDAVDEMFYIVGIREAGELLEGRSTRAPHAPEITPKLPEVGAYVLPDSLDGISETGSFVSAINTLPMAPEGQHAEGEKAVWVDTAKTGMPMQCCTPAFLASFGGPSLRVGSAFVSWASRPDSKAVVGKIQDMVHLLLLDGASDVEDMQLELRLPHMKDLFVDVVVSLSVSSMSSATMSQEQVLPLVKLTFRRLKYKRKQGRPSRTSGKRRAAVQPQAQGHGQALGSLVKL